MRATEVERLRKTCAAPRTHRPHRPPRTRCARSCCRPAPRAGPARRGERRLRVEDRRQPLVLDADQLRGVLRDVPRARHHRRHGLADEAHAVDRQDGSCVWSADNPEAPRTTTRIGGHMPARSAPVSTRVTPGSARAASISMRVDPGMRDGRRTTRRAPSSAAPRRRRSSPRSAQQSRVLVAQDPLAEGRRRSCRSLPRAPAARRACTASTMCCRSPCSGRRCR